MKNGYYSSGEFAKMAKVTLRTIRFYDKKNILKPSYVSESGARFYSAEDFGKLQQILLLKYLGFSLEEIKEMLIEETDSEMFRHSLSLQKKLIQDKIEQMQMVEDSIHAMEETLGSGASIDWNQMLDIINLTSMETSLRNQYQNADNISSRIRLHKQYSVNKQGWFPWLLSLIMEHTGSSQCKILEIGCGDGELWTCSRENIPENISVVLSDISQGMVRDARRNIGKKDKRFSFKVFNAANIPYEDQSFDLVIANHMLFYCQDVAAQIKEVGRVLKPGGCFICSTYGSRHMHEITDLVQEFDSRIVLSGEKLYERFGLDQGAELLSQYFSPDNIECRRYEDEIVIDKAEPLMEYIRSCHGNQNQYLLNRYNDFKEYMTKKVKKGYHISKDAGAFICRKK